jgi:hypothetical protein
MRLSFAVPFVVVISSVLTAVAQTCPLDGFDQGPPAGARDETPPSETTHFQWGSDLDPGDPRARSWHYIHNLHEQKLSAHWKKPGLLIPFNKPLSQGYTTCSYDYGSETSFQLDEDAPITTNGDGDKAAVAYVRSRTAAEDAIPAVTGTEIRSDYTSELGERITGIAAIILSYFSADRFLQIQIFSGPQGEKMAFSPSEIGVEIEDVIAQLQEIGVESVEIPALNEIVEFDELTFNALGANEAGRFVRFGARETMVLKFDDIDDLPTEESHLLLFAPDGSLIAAKTFSMAVLQSET